MTAIILTIHTMIVIALVILVLLQRSEGGALGMGGGGGGLMSGRGAATALTRTTTVLAALFFTSSLTLALIADTGEADADFLPGQTEEDLATDDFSDFLTEDEPQPAGEPDVPDDAFTLPENLGVGEEPAAPTGEETAPDEPEEPQR